ncbi:MAG: hypothetical protein H0T89_29495 [Deltaproteobacteria bacterium]|nr:hypothetical protein [Deltaproteobacteria bacterium]
MIDERAILESAIEQEPDRIDNYLVLADVLTAAGDPRGELTVIMHRDDPVLADRRRELMDADRGSIFRETGDPVEMTWRLGWPQAATLDLSVARHRLQLAALLDHPASRFLAELHVTIATTGDDDTLPGSNLDEVLEVLARRPRPLLRSLSIVQREIGGGSHAPGWLTVPDVECGHEPDALWPCIPKVERLRASGGPMFHALIGPALRTLVVEGAPFCDHGDWEAPQLASLDARCDLHELATLCGRELPALRDLTVRGVSFDPDSMFAYAEIGAVVRALDRLRVPVSFIAGHGGDLEAAIERHVDDLEHLATLVITGVEPASIHGAVGVDTLPNLTLLP